MEIQDIRTGVIGTGSMGQNHARVYSEVSNFIGIFDLDSEQSKSISKKYSCKNFNSLDSLLSEVDAVTIAVPSKYHNEVFTKVIENEKHILIEKPLSLSVKACQEMVKLYESSSIVVSVGHIERHNKLVEYAKKAIDSGQWGEVLTFSSKRLSNFPQRIKDVGVTLDLAVHDLDIIHYLSNSEIKSIKSEVNKNINPDFEDQTLVLVKFINGNTAVCEANWLTPNKVREMSITTDSHYIVMNYISNQIQLHKSFYLDTNSSNLYNPKLSYESETINFEFKEPLKLEIEDFLDSIHNKRRPLVDIYDGLRAVKMAEQALLNSKKSNVF